MSSWWLEPYRQRERYMMPFERVFGQMFEEAFREMDRAHRSIAPYWLEQAPLHECNIGNTVGKVVDDKDKFAVEMDVSQFHPEELKVNVRDNELIVEGHHEERSDSHGSIERHFIRKYTLPKDTHLEGLVSHLSDKGVLSVSAPKHTLEGPPARNIPIQAAPRTPQQQSKQEEAKK
uniref:SHSP domain-containing protein n=2 Tax=Ascaris TaxID=6251 RepID=A0A0M3HNY5_ASCLU